MDSLTTEERITGAENVLWDLSDLYPSASDPAFKNDLDTIGPRCADFNRRWKGQLGSLDIPAFMSMVTEYEDLIETLDRMGSFAQLIWSTDTEDPNNGKLLQLVRETGARASQPLVFLSIELSALSAERIAELMNAPEMASRRHWLERVMEYKPFNLSEEVEKVLAVKNLAARAAWVRMHDELMASQVFRLNGKEYTEAQILKLLHEPDRATRKAAAESVSAGLAEGIKAQTYIFNTVLADHMANDQLRGHDSWVSSRNLANEASDASVQALIDSVVDRYDLVRRYYALKKKLLGYADFFDYDRYASVGTDETFWSWESARDIVVEAYSRFDPRAGEIAQMFFDRNWIHAPVRKGKNGGAYSAGTIASAHPYVFMNYTGTNRDVQVLAHELGHGIHQYLSRQQGPLLMDTPLTIAETASVFGEILTFNLLYESVTDDKTRLVMLMNKLDDILSTVFRQISLNRFEEAMHVARRTEGELSTDRMCELWVKTQSFQFADTVTLSPGYKYWWSYISHFMHVPGYVYAYAYGELLVLALHEIYKSDNAGFPDKYIALLSSGGAKKPTELLAPFNINVEDPEFWKTGLGVIERLINEAERLAG